MSSIADRRSAALAEFARAKEQGYKFNAWAELAEEMAALLAAAPKPKTKGDLDRAQWADYRSPAWRQKGYEKGEWVVTFADGEVVKVSHPNHASKPFNWGEASRIAIAFWRLRARFKAIGCVPMDVGDKYERRLTPPAITAMQCNGVCGNTASA